MNLMIFLGDFAFTGRWFRRRSSSLLEKRNAETLRPKEDVCRMIRDDTDVSLEQKLIIWKIDGIWHLLGYSIAPSCWVL